MPWLWGRFKDFLREDDAWLSGVLSIVSGVLGLRAADQAGDAAANAAAAARAEAAYNIAAADIQIANLQRSLETADRRKGDLEARLGLTDALVDFTRRRADYDIDTIRIGADYGRGEALVSAAERGVQVGQGSSQDTQSSLDFLEARDVANREDAANIEIQNRHLEAREARTALQAFNDQITEANLEIQDLQNRKVLFKRQGELGARAASLQGTAASLTALGQAFQHGVNAFNYFQNSGKH